MSWTVEGADCWTVLGDVRMQKVNKGLPRVGEYVSIDGRPDCGVTFIGAIDYDAENDLIYVYLPQLKAWALYNNCTPITEE